MKRVTSDARRMSPSEINPLAPVSFPVALTILVDIGTVVREAE